MQKLVLNAMLAQELISPEAYEQALSEDVIGNLADNMENRKDSDLEEEQEETPVTSKSKDYEEVL